MARFAIVITVLVLVGFGYLAFRDHPDVTDPRRLLDRIPTTVEPFHPPQPGDRVRIELITGAAREGVIRDIDRDSVMIETPNGEITYPRRNIAPESRRLLFEDDFKGVPPERRPATISDEELVHTLSKDPSLPDDERGWGSRVQYVISGTNAIIIYRGVEE